MKLKIWIHSLV